MEVEYVPSYCSLQQELDNAKNMLVTLNDNIRRIIGRDPRETPRFDKYNDNKRSDLERNDSGKDNGGSANKRRNLDSKSVFNRLSAPPPRNTEDEFRPRLNSRVIRELPTRQEIVAAQGSDAQSRARNKRMFGSLLGTLQKFCLEESRLKQKEDKKAQVEKKLEQQQMKERETMKKERELLFLDRKRKQMEIRKLELKMSRLKDYEVWESSQKYIKGYIKTKAKPCIYFKPRILNKTAENLLTESRNALKKEMIKKKEAVNKEIAEIEDRFKISEDDRGNINHEINNIEMDNEVSEVKDLDSKEIEQTQKGINGNIHETHSVSNETQMTRDEADSKENVSQDFHESTLNNNNGVGAGASKELGRDATTLE